LVSLDIKTPRVFVPLLAPARYKGAHGGRGSGKSHFYADLIVERCLREFTRAVCVREIQRSLEQSVKRLIEDKIAEHGLESKFKVLESRIEAPHGGVIIFQGMQNHTSQSIKSLEGYHVAWVEEAQSLSQSSLTLLRPTIRVPNSEIWFSWNPRSPKDAVDNFLRREPPADSVVVEANYEDNPWFPDGLRADMEYDRRRDPERYKHVWLGQYQTTSEARVFHNWKIEEFETPREAVFYHGCDWGFSVDPTVLIRCFVVDRSLYVDAESWQVGCPIDHTPALFDRLDPDPKRHASARRWVIVADSANPQNINYMSRHGYPKMRPSIKGVGSVEEGVEFLKSFDIVVHPRCRHVADELANYSYKIDPKTEQVLPQLADDKNHTIDSLRYAIEALRRRAPQLALGGY